MILAVEGPNACGKSTFIDTLIARLKKDHPRGPPIHMLDIRQHTHLGKDVVKTMNARDTFHLSESILMRMAAAHIELIENAMCLEKISPCLVILARTLPSFYVYQYAQSSLCDKALELYQRFLSPWEYSSEIVYMATDYATTKQRLISRGDAEHLMEDLGSLWCEYQAYFTGVRKPNYTVADQHSSNATVEQISQAYQQLGITEEFI